jgi:chromosome segregation ATPase
VLLACRRTPREPESLLPKSSQVLSADNSTRALQEYICDLEVEKLALQRGLQQQSELVERLAAEHQDATERFQAVADERAQFEKELRECQGALAEQVRSCCRDACAGFLSEL